MVAAVDCWLEPTHAVTCSISSPARPSTSRLSKPRVARSLHSDCARILIARALPSRSMARVTAPGAPSPAGNCGTERGDCSGSAHVRDLPLARFAIDHDVDDVTRLAAEDGAADRRHRSHDREEAVAAGSGERRAG